MLFLKESICDLSCEPSLLVNEAAITGRETPHALPRARKKHHYVKGQSIR